MVQVDVARDTKLISAAASSAVIGGPSASAHRPPFRLDTEWDRHCGRRLLASGLVLG